MPVNLLVPILFNRDEVSYRVRPTADNGDGTRELGDFINIGEFNWEESAEFRLLHLFMYSNSIISRNKIY